MTEAHSGAAVRPDRPQQRNLDYLQPQRDAQRRIKTALHAYVALEQQIEQIHTAAHNDINQIRQQQAIVVWQISHTGRTVQQIAELLDISQADTWQLLSTGRTAAAHATDNRPSPSTNPPDQQQPPPPPPHPWPAPPDMPSKEQRIPSRAAAHQHRTDPDLIPPITHRSGGARKRAVPDGITQTRD
jgi:hypothetical protein